MAKETLTASSTPSSFSDLATKITTQARLLDEHMKTVSLSFPSHRNVDAPHLLPPDAPRYAQDARAALIATATQLLEAALGPRDYIVDAIFSSVRTIASLRAVHGLGIARAIPVPETATATGKEYQTYPALTYAQLALKTGVDADFLQRIVRVAASRDILAEDDNGLIRHTARSACLATDPSLQAVVGHHLDMTVRSACFLNEAVTRFDYAKGNPQETALNLAYDTSLPLFELLEQPSMATQRNDFHHMMAGGVSSPAFNAVHVANARVWNTLAPEPTIVDIGGSTGHISRAIALQHPSFRFIIQDKAEVVSDQKVAHAADPLVTNGILTYQAHDFFTSQPKTHAAVYFLRYILHDWSDTYAARILANVATAMGPQSKIVIADRVLPARDTVSLEVDGRNRVADLGMLLMMHGRERDREAWQRLVTLADRRLRLEDVETPEGSGLAILTVGLKPETANSSGEGKAP